MKSRAATIVTAIYSVLFWLASWPIYAGRVGVWPEPGMPWVAVTGHLYSGFLLNAATVYLIAALGVTIDRRQQDEKFKVV